MDPNPRSGAQGTLVMTSQIEEASANLSEDASQSVKPQVLLDANNVVVLPSLTELRKSDQVSDEEENEVDLMIQLSGMVYNSVQLGE
jgi:metallophosphoesterase superfamily enzyme